MYRRSNYIRTICEVGIFAALGYVLDELQGALFKGVFINGGAIGFAMIAVIIIGYRRGWLPAIITGLIMGLLDVSTSAYIIHPAQLFLDYIFPYAFVGIGCLFQMSFRRTNTTFGRCIWLVVGIFVGGMLKFLSHYLAGVIFWSDPSNFAWGLNSMNPYLYCFIYNIAFVGPTIVLTSALAVVMLIRAPSIFLVEQAKVEQPESGSKIIPLIANSVIISGATACFIYFLIKYITSFYGYKDGSAVGYDFDPDSMIIFIIAIFIMILCGISYYRLYQSRFSWVFYAKVLLFFTSSSFIYGTARLIRMYVKGKDPSLYWIWFGIGLFTLLANIAFLVIMKIKEKRINEANQSV